jgi:organic hydroperoxide reductase OsmC/OhrA
LIVVRPLEGKKLRCSIRGHVVTTDRPPEDGGGDAGCTSGELLLMAVGSCAMGSLRKALSNYRLSPDEIAVEVAFTPAAPPNDRDAILITVRLADRALAAGSDAIARAATSGRVVSRVRLGSTVNVRSLPMHAPAQT